MFNLWSANAFSLDKAKILSSATDFKRETVFCRTKRKIGNVLNCMTPVIVNNCSELILSESCLKLVLIDKLMIRHLVKIF